MLLGRLFNHIVPAAEGICHYVKWEEE